MCLSVKYLPASTADAVLVPCVKKMSFTMRLQEPPALVTYFVQKEIPLNGALLPDRKEGVWWASPPTPSNLYKDRTISGGVIHAYSEWEVHPDTWFTDEVPYVHIPGKVKSYPFIPASFPGDLRKLFAPERGTYRDHWTYMFEAYAFNVVAYGVAYDLVAHALYVPGADVSRSRRERRMKAINSWLEDGSIRITRPMLTRLFGKRFAEEAMP